MRVVIDRIINDLESQELGLIQYCPWSCATCIHSSRGFWQDPCSSCSTATEEAGREYKPSDKLYWEPNEHATHRQIRAFHTYHGLKTFEQYLQYPPARCINPRCPDHEHVSSRGLCTKCLGLLDEEVRRDEEEAERWRLMYWLADSDIQREEVLNIYGQLATWDRFIQLGLCLPLPEEIKPANHRELILYYRQARLNVNRGLNATPTAKQLARVLTPEQLALARTYLEVK